MEKIEGLEARGERARLFPVLNERSKEGRTLSIVLATMAQVPEFAASLLAAIGRRSGTRTRVEAYTEVAFPKSKTSAALRPDGLLVVDTGRTRWSAFIEAKIGKEEIDRTQLEAYLTLAREVGVDAVITFTNAFAALPEHHPVKVSKRLTRSVELFHFSWFSLVTMTNLLAANEEVGDDDHSYLLRELERFLLHPSAGLKRHDSMGAQWSEALDLIRQGQPLKKGSDDTLTIVSAWESEIRDLCLLLARKTGARVTLKISPKNRADPRRRLQSDAERLASRGVLQAQIDVPDAAAPIDVEADLTTRTTRVSMQLSAPKDRKRQSACLSWLVRQLAKLDDEHAGNVVIVTNWPGKAAATTSTLLEAREDPDQHSYANRSSMPTSFTVMMLMTDGRRFAGPRTFVETLEELVVDEFYGNVAHLLSAWRAPPRKLKPAPEESVPDSTPQSDDTLEDADPGP